MLGADLSFPVILGPDGREKQDGVLDRQDVLEDALQRLSSPARARGGRGVLVALTGMGGAGKSVLAAQIAARSDELGFRAEDVLWLRADSRPGDSLLAEALEALGESRGGTGPLSMRRLRERLSDRHCLIVLDNVTDYGQIEAVDAVGPGSAILVTTHLRVLPPDTGVCEVPLLDPADPAGFTASMQLLALHAGEPPSAKAEDAARRIISRCGGLPLALAISAQTERAARHRRGLVGANDRAQSELGRGLVAEPPARQPAPRQAPPPGVEHCGDDPRGSGGLRV
jgi:hypothetical protein